MDGLLGPEDAERWRAHVAECALCQRYDRVLRSGVKLLRQQPALDPGSDLLLHLQFRLMDEDRRAALRPVSATTMTALTVGAVIALLAWAPILVLMRSAERPGTFAAESSINLDVNATEIAWHGGSAMTEREPSHDALSRTPAWDAAPLPIHPGQLTYTPVIVESPTAAPRYAPTTAALE